MAKELTVHNAIREFGYHREDSFYCLFPHYWSNIREASDLVGLA